MLYVRHMQMTFRLVSLFDNKNEHLSLIDNETIFLIELLIIKNMQLNRWRKPMIWLIQVIKSKRFAPKTCSH